MTTTFSPEFLEAIRKPLRDANTHFAHSHPGLSPDRQPIHTVYGGAHLFTSMTARKLGDAALRCLQEFAPDGKTLCAALGAPAEAVDLWNTVHERVTSKLQIEAVEDFRIDFEDGYGNRPDEEEDGHAQKAAQELARGISDRSNQALPPFIGIRIKPLSEECATRSLRTLDLFITTLVQEADPKLLPVFLKTFVVTLPKITTIEQPKALLQCLKQLEKANNLPDNSLKFEIMVETPQSVLDDHGRSPLRAWIDASQGRCVAAHFGTYDYTAGCNITANYQTMLNPVCDFAKHVMQVSLAGTPLFLSDGATNVMPVGTVETIHRAWRLSSNHIRHSLETGYYQGWDLHPNQIPIRYATMYAFFLEGLEPVSQRLKLFVEKAAKATLLGDVFDDAATGQGLLNFFLRGMSCGAINESEALATGLTLAEIQSRSFLKILEGRKQ